MAECRVSPPSFRLFSCPRGVRMPSHERGRQRVGERQSERPLTRRTGAQRAMRGTTLSLPPRQREVVFRAAAADGLIEEMSRCYAPRRCHALPLRVLPGCLPPPAACCRHAEMREDVYAAPRATLCSATRRTAPRRLVAAEQRQSRQVVEA